MQGIFIGYFLFFTLLIGILIGWYAGVYSKKTDYDNSEHIKYVPTISEILNVLNMIYISYGCSSHEKECLEEAIRLFEEMLSEDE